MTLFARILVPLDGSPAAEAALAHAAYLARLCQAKLLLLHTLEERPPHTVHGQPHLHHREGAERYLSERVQSLWGASAEVAGRGGDVARSIVEEARREPETLTVLCTHGQGGLRHRLLGSVAQRVLQIGARAVLMVRPPASAEEPPPEYHRLLLTLDGTAEGEAALPTALELARLTGAWIHLVRVVPTRPALSLGQAPGGSLLPTATQAVLDLEAEQALSYLEVVRERVGRRASLEVPRGEPARQIARVASRVGTDLLVLATHGRSGLDAARAGSVADRVVDAVLAPILLIRAPD